MLSENIKTLRIKKGLSQEILAQQLNVVRQTVSKWEKGLSVPDAEMLTHLADTLAVSVNDLLGEKVQNVNDMNEVAAQLAILNEFLAMKNRRRRKIWKGILIAVVAVVILFLLVTMLLTRM